MLKDETLSTNKLYNLFNPQFFLVIQNHLLPIHKASEHGFIPIQLHMDVKFTFHIFHIFIFHNIKSSVRFLKPFLAIQKNYKHSPLTVHIKSGDGLDLAQGM
jgi:hypothetical protein